MSPINSCMAVCTHLNDYFNVKVKEQCAALEVALLDSACPALQFLGTAVQQRKSYSFHAGGSQLLIRDWRNVTEGRDQRRGFSPGISYIPARHGKTLVRIESPHPTDRQAEKSRRRHVTRQLRAVPSSASLFTAPKAGHKRRPENPQRLSPQIYSLCVEGRFPHSCFLTAWLALMRDIMTQIITFTERIDILRGDFMKNTIIQIV